MKKIGLLFASAFALLVIAACDDEKEDIKVIDTPVVTLSPLSVTLSAEAVDNYTINYTVTNAVSGAMVSAAADVSWITDIDCSVSGQIVFSVEANTSFEMRTATLILTYSYDDGVVTAEAAVIQYGADEPVLSVDPNVVIADAEGGVYSFGYTVENPIDGESVDCYADVDWISDFDYDTPDIISFTIAASEEEELRTGIITVSYATLSVEVTVIQDHPDPGEDVDDFDGSIDSLIGTYSAWGYACDDSKKTAVSAAWTMTIYRSDDDEVIIDGLTPRVEGEYPDTDAYIAYAHLNSDGQFIIPSQFTNHTYLYSDGETYEIGLFPSTNYADGPGWYFDWKGPDCTLTYDPETKVWTSDYGMFIGLFISQDFMTLCEFLDVTNPGFQISKIANGDY